MFVPYIGPCIMHITIIDNPFLEENPFQGKENGCDLQEGDSNHLEITTNSTF